jgi:hypothetical protein
MDALPHPQDRVRALRRRQQLLLAAGRINADSDPLVVCAAGEPTPQERAGRIRDRLLGQERAKPGESVTAGYSFAPRRLKERKD